VIRKSLMPVCSPVDADGPNYTGHSLLSPSGNASVRVRAQAAYDKAKQATDMHRELLVSGRYGFVSITCLQGDACQCLTMIVCVH